MTGTHDLPTDAPDVSPATATSDAGDATVGGPGGGDGAGHPPRCGRRFGRRLLRGLATVSAVVIALGLVGGVAQAIAERRDAAAHPPPGELVEVDDGRSIHLQVSGEQHEGPTVVLEAGLMGFSSIWAWVQPMVAEQATVVSYDRAGLGWSDPRDGDPSAGAFVEDLRAALDARDLDGPYVLVGHSFGGLLVRGFADSHPEEVAGLVLVDPAHEEQEDELGEEYAAALDRGDRLMAVADVATRVGITRLHNPLATGLQDLPETESLRATPRLLRTDYLTAVRAERAAVDRLSDHVRESDHDLGETPVRILSAGRPEPGMQFSLHTLQELHRRLTHLSTGASHQIVDDAHHLSILTRRDHAEEVSAHIIDVVSDGRQ